MEARDKRILIQSVSAVLIIVVLFNVYSGITVSNIVIPGLIDLKFNSSGGSASGNSETVNQKSEKPTYDDDINSSVDDFRPIQTQRTNNTPFQSTPNGVYEPGNTDEVYTPIRPEPNQPELIDLNGMWYGEDGSEYEIAQNGGTVYFTEYGVFGVTAQGSGSYQNNRLVFDYNTAFGTSGRATLDVSQNGQVISGIANDFTSGVSTQLYLRRY